MRMLTFTEAAEYAGVNVKTIHKHVKQGKLECVSTPFGRRIPEAALAPYRELKGLIDHEEPATASPVREQASAPRINEERHATPQEASPDPGPPTAAVTTHERPATSGAFLERSATDVVPLSAHLAALDLIERLHQQVERSQADARADVAEERRRTEQAERTRELAERGRMALEFQLQQYQTALGEQAASLAEERALRVAAEARAAELFHVEQAATTTPEALTESTPTSGPEAEPMPMPKPERKGWGRRVRGWLGLSQAN